MSQRIEKLSGDNEFAPAITEVSRNEYGTLHVDARNLSPPVADIIATAREQSRFVCEFCSYSPAFLRTGKMPQAGHIACGRCARGSTGKPKRRPTKRTTKPRRAPDIVVVKR